MTKPINEQKEYSLDDVGFKLLGFRDVQDLIEYLDQELFDSFNTTTKEKILLDAETDNPTTKESLFKMIRLFFERASRNSKALSELKNGGGDDN